MLEPILLFVVGGGGLGALIFAALRFNREDSTAAVNLMRGLQEELRQDLMRCKNERVELERELRAKARELKLKDAEVRALEAQLRRHR